ncbi:MAG: GAF domain-containing protein [Anaerolineae bacterium]|nr:GAF domain-containing protein [Anaerolineae bacterium]
MVAIHSQTDSSREIEVLAEVSLLLTQFDMNRVLGKVIRLLANAVGAAQAHLALHPNYDLDWRHIFRTDNLNPDMIFSARVGGLESGLAGLAACERRALLVQNAETDERRAHFESELQTGSALCIPFICNQDMMGVLTLLHPDAGHFTPAHQRLMLIGVNQAAVAIHNARMENQVVAQRRQVESLLHAIKSIVLVLDKRGRVLLMNSVAEHFLNAAEVKTPVPLSDLVGTNRAFEQVLSVLDNPPLDEKTWMFKARSDADKKDFEVLIAVWENPMQDSSGYVVVMHDVTTLTDLDRFKNEMLKMASHDLRSPLALISGYCDLIELDLPETMSNAQRYINTIRRTTERMDNMLNDLLRVEQIHSSPLELHRRIEINEMLQTVIEDARPAADRKKHQLRSEIQAETMLDGIMGDPVTLREAMENFISNAIKYTPDGGQIVVCAGVEENRFLFSVRDNGIGIGKEHMPRLFNSFYRAKQPGTEHIEGTGIGLSLVKTIVEWHKGNVWVESEEGKGSTFGFWLPK